MKLGGSTKVKVCICLLSVLIAVGVLAGCSSDSLEARFCRRIEAVSSPDSPVTVEQTLANLRELLEVTPLVVREDVNTMINIFQEFINTPDPEDAVAQLSANQADIDRSAQNLQEYVSTRCGISLQRWLPSDPNAPIDPTTSPASPAPAPTSAQTASTQLDLMF